jgi:hypothetical protein
MSGGGAVVSRFNGTYVLHVRSKLLVFAFALALAPVACSPGDGSSGPTSTSTSSTAGPSGCPVALPADGAACPKESLGCSYGDSPTADCRDEVTCTSAGWHRLTSQCNGTPDACTASVAEKVACDDAKRAACLGAGDVLCVCSTCEGSSGAMCNAVDATWRWACVAPPAAPSPAALPNDGTACGAEGALCSYGFPCHGFRGVLAVCEAGAWVWQGRGCPG